MPVLTDGELMTLIVDEVNDPAGRVSARIQTIWMLYARYPPPLRYQMALVKACGIALGSIRDDVNFNQSGDLAVQLAQKFDHVNTILQAAVAERDRVRAELQSAAAPSVGYLTQTAPVLPPTGAIDGNEIESPYLPRVRGRRR